MGRRPSHIPKRKPFPKAVKLAVLKRSGGSCEAEGCGNPGRDFDHIDAVAFGGESTLENCQLLCRQCNADKAIDEARRAARADKKGGRSGQYARRKRNGPKIKSPAVSPLNSRHPNYRKRRMR